jgi:hypothetical protein
MNEPAKRPPVREVAEAPVEIHCRRLGRSLPVEEHVKCLYCFGQAGEILTGDHAKFCDFDPEKDPIHFGFPDGGGWVGER